jgi:hypothetical protein
MRIYDICMTDKYASGTFYVFLVCLVISVTSVTAPLSSCQPWKPRPKGIFQQFKPSLRVQPQMFDSNITNVTLVPNKSALSRSPVEVGRAGSGLSRWNDVLKRSRPARVGVSGQGIVEAPTGTEDAYIVVPLGNAYWSCSQRHCHGMMGLLFRHQRVWGEGGGWGAAGAAEAPAGAAEAPTGC